jgi:hypothetical protein
MVEFLVENYSNKITLPNENQNDPSIFILEKYFFNYVNDSKQKSREVIRRFKLIKTDLNSNVAIKAKNSISLTDYFAVPFLIIQKLLDSIDGRVCILGRIKISFVLW